MKRFFRNLWLLLTSYDIKQQMEYDSRILVVQNQLAMLYRDVECQLTMIRGIESGKYLPPRIGRAPERTSSPAPIALAIAAEVERQIDGPLVLRGTPEQGIYVPSRRTKRSTAKRGKKPA